MATLLLKIALTFDAFLYKAISFLAIKHEGGLHPKYRIIRYADFFLKRIGTSDRVLDIGCGGGALAFDISKKALFVKGIDIIPANIEKAKKKFGADNIEYVCGDATTDLPDEKFDIVVLSNVLEHIDRRIDFLKSIRAVANRYLIRVPMFDREWLVPFKKELGVEWRLDMTHFTEFTLEQFKDEIKDAGYELKEYSVQWGELWAELVPNVLP